MPSENQKLTDAIVDKAMAKIRDREPPALERDQSVITSEADLQKIEARKTCQYGSMVSLPVAERDALCQTVRALRAKEIGHILITATDNATYDRLVNLLLEEDYEPAGSSLDADDILRQIIAERNALRETLTALRNCQNKPVCGHCAALLRAAASLTLTGNTRGLLS